MIATTTTTFNRLPEDALADAPLVCGSAQPQGLLLQSENALHAALQRYLDERGLRGSTPQGLYAIRRYGQDFIRWCAGRGVHHISQISVPILRDYQAALHTYRQANGKPLSVNSRLAKLVPLRGWLLWLARQGELPADLCGAMVLPRADRVLPRGLLAQQDVEALLAAPDLSNPIGLRDRAMLELLYSSGLRRMELAGLQLRDLDLSRNMLWVRQGKGRKDRVLPLTESAVHWMTRYLAEARPLFVGHRVDPGQVFVGRFGKPLSLAWLSQIVAQHVRAAHPGRAGSCHLLRHAMATLMLEGGADIRYIQAMLGHAQLVTTQIYTHVAIGKLQAVHAQSHPGARGHVKG